MTGAESRAKIRDKGGPVPEPKINYFGSGNTGLLYSIPNSEAAADC